MKAKKVVLAYSGGLDTSVIAKWLNEEYGCEVITFTADIGQGSEIKEAKHKAQKLGIKKIYIEDLQEKYKPKLDLIKHERARIKQYQNDNFFLY